MKLSLALALLPFGASFLACSSPSDDASTRTDDIENGQEVTIESAPWQVVLWQEGHGSEQSYGRCGGVVIAPSWVLTARHCFLGYSPGDELHVIAGNADLRQSREGEQYRAVNRVFPYGLPSAPQAPWKAYPEDVDREHDIALVHLETPLDLGGAKVKAIGLVDAAGAAAGLTDPGVKAVVTGFGQREPWSSKAGMVLEGGTTTILSREAAEAAIHAIPVEDNPEGWNYQTLTLGEGELATDGTGARHCHGDSGGPLTVAGPGDTRLLAGLVSWGPSCDDTRLPGVHVRVSAFGPWIAETMAATDEVYARAAAMRAAAGFVAADRLDVKKACQLTEAAVFDIGVGEIRALELDLASFRCEGATLEVETRARERDPGRAVLAAATVKTRGPSPRTLVIEAHLLQLWSLEKNETGDYVYVDGGWSTDRTYAKK